MTAVAATCGQIVMVAIHAAKPKIDANTAITEVSFLSEIQSAFMAPDSNPTAMKSPKRVGVDA